MMCNGFSITFHNKVLTYNDCCNVIGWETHKAGLCMSCSKTLQDLDDIKQRQNEILNMYFPKARRKRRIITTKNRIRIEKFE